MRFASKSKDGESRLPKLKLLALKSHRENANILSIKCLACGFTERNLNPLPLKVNSQLEEILPKVAQTSQKKKKKKKRKSNVSQNGSLVNNQLNQSISSSMENANNKTKANTNNANNKTKENIKNNPNDSSISKLNKSSIKIAKPKISLVTKNSKPNQTAKKISALKEALQHTKSIQKSKSSLKSFLDSVF